jgi:hypothetical protein
MLLWSRLLSKNIKMRIYKIIILPAVLYWCETWSLILREKHRLSVFENRVLRRIFGPRRNEMTGDWSSKLWDFNACLQVRSKGDPQILCIFWPKCIQWIHNCRAMFVLLSVIQHVTPCQIFEKFRRSSLQCCKIFKADIHVICIGVLYMKLKCVLKSGNRRIKITIRYQWLEWCQLQKRFVLSHKRILQTSDTVQYNPCHSGPTTAKDFTK